MPLPDEKRVTLTSALVAWLEFERAEAVAGRELRGVPLTTKSERILARRTHSHTERSGEWRLDYIDSESVELSSLSSLANRSASIRWRPQTASPLAQETAPESDALRHNRELIEQMLLGDYLTRLLRPLEPDISLATRLVVDYLDYLFCPEISEVEDIQLGGIVPPVDAIESSGGELSIRALDARELGLNLRRAWGFDGVLGIEALGSLISLADRPHSLIDNLMGCMMSVRTVRLKRDHLEHRSV